MVVGKLPVPGRPTILITVGQGPTALVVGAGGGCLVIFTLIYPFSPLSPSLWETARYRLKYCLKGPLNPKEPTNQSNQRRYLLEKASVDEITTLSEIAYNILGGVFALSESELTALQRHKTVLRTLAAKHFQVSEKRAALVKSSVAVKHLLTVFFRHYQYSDNGGRGSSENNSDSTNSVPAACSESSMRIISFIYD